MITTEALTALGGPAPDPAAGSAPSELGRNEFLQMLIAQLENQDPLNPQDATEFTAQLAQFSSLEQLLSIGESIDQLAESELVSQQLGAAGLIGREITALGSQFAVGADGTPLAEPRFVLGSAAENATVNVLDANGRLVRTLSFGPLVQGEHAVDWDGLDQAGQPVEEGIYSFRVSALSGDTTVEAFNLVRGRVTGAIPGASNPLLLLGDLAVPLASVEEVSE
jgi:flagellar basal-body rod modification protein FlgD